MRTRALTPTLSTVALLFASLAAYPQSAFKGCTAEGRAKKTKQNPTGGISAATKAENRLKNRDGAPACIDRSVTLAGLLKEENNNAFGPAQGVEVTGYVASVTPGGRQESANCGRTDLRDIHVNVVLRKSQASDIRQHFVAEITPRWQERMGKDIDDVRREIKGKCVRFTGFLFYDSVHEGESENTKRRGREVWRRTAWEIHPVTSYSIVGHEDCPI